MRSSTLLWMPASWPIAWCALPSLQHLLLKESDSAAELTPDELTLTAPFPGSDRRVSDGRAGRGALRQLQNADMVRGEGGALGVRVEGGSIFFVKASLPNMQLPKTGQRIRVPQLILNL